MSNVLEQLTSHPDATDPEPFAGPDHPIRKITRMMAFGGEWQPSNATNMAELFDGMAAEWSERHVNPTKRAPVEDGLNRGGVPLDGDWLELGAGTGAGARVLSGRVGSLVCTDLSMGMLSYAPGELAPRVQADATTLPFSDDTFDAVLMINMILFPNEVDRILRPGGSVLWVNTLGDQTPIHLPAADVLEALPGEWHGRTARAGTGFWLAASRATS
jgi:SAM-dependent methyltransferase